MVETTVLVAQAQDPCLDHSVKELGMSAKRVDKERRWEIQARFLHSAVADGAFGVRMEPTDKGTKVAVKAAWPGAPKDKDTQLEIEERLRLMTAKMAQICGVVRPEVSCTFTAPGAKPTACTPTPTR